MTGVVTVRGPHSRERLRGWLSDLVTGAPEDADPETHRIRLRGLGTDLEFDAGLSGPIDPAFWAAAAVRRAVRRVPDAAECSSPGLAQVLESGTWIGPWAGIGHSDPAGVLVFKPGARVSGDILTDVAERLAECGYRAREARVVPAAQIVRQNLAVRHHAAYADLAQRDRTTEEERWTFARRFGTAACVARFGPPEELPIYPAAVAVEELGIGTERLSVLNREATARHGMDSDEPDGPSRIGECLYAQVIEQPDLNEGRPFAVLNAHMPHVIAEFNSADALAVLLESASVTPMPWPRMRREFCGATDPALALPGSVRGDALAGLLSLTSASGGRVQRTGNGIHLSNGAFEMMKDAWVWFGMDPGSTGAGRLLAAAGQDPRELVESPFVEVAGRRRAVQELTDKLDAHQAVAVLAEARPLPRDS